MRAACGCDRRERPARARKNSKASTWSAATERTRSCAVRPGSNGAGTDYDQVMCLAVFRSRELHDALKRFPRPRRNGSRLGSGCDRLLELFRPRRRWRIVFLSRGRFGGREGGNYDFLASSARAGFPVNLEFDYVGYLGFSGRSCRHLSSRAHPHRRRRRRQPSSVRGYGL